MSEMEWSPYAIEIIIHHHCSNTPFRNSDAPAYQDYVATLRERGILDYDDKSFLRTTLKGEALVYAWGATPAPVQKWVDPRFDAALQD